MRSRTNSANEQTAAGESMHLPELHRMLFIRSCAQKILLAELNFVL